MDIDGRVAFVTGGASGIGRAVVLALARRGARVAVVDLDGAGARATAELACGSDTTLAITSDVTDSADLAAAVDMTVERFGGLDIVANVAGIGDSDLFADDPGDWRRVIDIDLAAVVDGTRIAVRTMRHLATAGVVVNLASLIGLHPMAAAPVYSAAKAGVVAFTRALTELAEQDGIRVNAVCPEIVDTPLALAMGEDVLAELRASNGILTPEEVARVIVELVEDETRAGAVVRLTKADGASYV